MIPSAANFAPKYFPRPSQASGGYFTFDQLGDDDRFSNAIGNDIKGWGQTVQNALQTGFGGAVGPGGIQVNTVVSLSDSTLVSLALFIGIGITLGALGGIGVRKLFKVA